MQSFVDMKVAEVKLQMLEAGGVDNWTGYSESLQPEGEESFYTWEETYRKEHIG